MGSDRRLLRASDADALVAEVVARLRRGELVALPTETVYGLAALPSHPAAAARLRAWSNDDAEARTAHIASSDDLRPLARQVPPTVARLVGRYWPGPLTVVLPARHGGEVAVRVPAHAFTQQVIRAAGEPLWLAPVARGGEAPLVEPTAIAAAVPDLTLVVDDGRSPLGTPSTLVRATGPRLEVLREGILSASNVLHAAATLVLFVCTGNTCRSPLAAALARELTARQLGVAAADVLHHGLAFTSAGTGALPDLPASEGSLAVAAELGIDLGEHRSRPVDPVLLERADRIYCLGRGHLRAILAEAPAAGGKATLLRPDGLDVADPYGGDLRTYRRVRDEIRAAVGARLREWLPPTDG
ncbi:MAG: Sua5/YciO/YrdC/YwlC family protein [Planctomycetes bacterium]|nr:Sua5/YciO/YrdC/YwlC family protein [Planctomycetota bacterium]